MVRYPCITDIHTYIQKSNTVVALAQAGIEARLRLGWQVGVGARLTEKDKCCMDKCSNDNCLGSARVNG